MGGLVGGLWEAYQDSGQTASEIFEDSDSGATVEA